MVAVRCAFASAALASLFASGSSHSWVACTDYRGDVNFFEQDKCVAWPRGYRPEPQAHGYQIASPETRAWGNGGCDRPMATPDWRASYSEAFPHAVYEAGRVYCLAWPMKNHATAPDSCTNHHAKSDPGESESLTLLVSAANPDGDPTQAEFYQRNINELAGLATGCGHAWSEKGDAGSQEMADECQLGLERHQTGVSDCKGFQRAPKFCENTGEAMGTGCFLVPPNMTSGHYVAQWVWDATFEGRGSFGYSTCFDFEVVPRDSGAARPGRPGTVGVAESELPCRNNMLKFQELGLDVGPVEVPETVSELRPTSGPVAPQQPQPVEPEPESEQEGQEEQEKEVEAEAGEGACIGPHEHCAQPGWPRPACCTTGYTCTFWDDHWARCLPESEAPVAQTGASTTPMASRSCAQPYEHCAGPSGWGGPTCCTSGHECVFANEHWARCEPRPALVATELHLADGPKATQLRGRASAHGFLSVASSFVQLGAQVNISSVQFHEPEL